MRIEKIYKIFFNLLADIQRAQDLLNSVENAPENYKKLLQNFNESLLVYIDEMESVIGGLRGGSKKNKSSRKHKSSRKNTRKH